VLSESLRSLSLVLLLLFRLCPFAFLQNRYSTGLFGMVVGLLPGYLVHMELDG